MSGNEVRKTSATGGQKGAKDARMDLIPVGPLTELSELYGEGAKKYDNHNWRKGYDWSLSYAAAMRHLTQFWNGEDRDEEMGSKHVINAVFHLFALAQFMDDFPGYDDRFKRVAPWEKPDFKPLVPQIDWDKYRAPIVPTIPDYPWRIGDTPGWNPNQVWATSYGVFEVHLDGDITQTPEWLPRPTEPGIYVTRDDDPDAPIYRRYEDGRWFKDNNFVEEDELPLLPLMRLRPVGSTN